MASAVIVLGMLLPPAARAQTPKPEARPFRTRGANADAFRLIRTAMDSSPTVARLVATLESSDLIIVVEYWPVPRLRGGDLRLLAASPHVRHVRIRVQRALSLRERISVLGHELQHAVELAAAPEVRTDSALASLFRRIGYAHGSGSSFETEAAVATGMLVAKELGRGDAR